MAFVSLDCSPDAASAQVTGQPVDLCCYFFTSGPSPRGWGNRGSPSARAAIVRAIPTRVGKSIRLARTPILTSGHPHAGGEIVETPQETQLILGPSPRGWGNPNRAILVRCVVRAIPTRVGKSRSRCPPHRKSSGHPHAGGEIRGKSNVPRSHHGPSPRGWGNRNDIRHHRRKRRAIPTRVGKSGPPRSSSCRHSGHPHAGGEISGPE